MSINQIYMNMQEQNSFVLQQRIFCPPHVPRNFLSKKVFLSQYTSSQKEQVSVGNLQIFYHWIAPSIQPQLPAQKDIE